MSATRAWCGSNLMRVSDKWVLVITSTETKAFEFEAFDEGGGATALLAAATEKRGQFIEPTEILVGT